LQWYIFDDCFRVFIITRNLDPIVWSSSTQDLQALEDWSDKYRKTYASEKSLWRHLLASNLRRLAEILHIDDILTLLPTSYQSLILIPHRYLHLFPLHALPVSTGQNYLIDKFRDGVKYAPSCQLLQLAKKSTHTEQKYLFAIQDPNANLSFTNIEVETITQHFAKVEILKKHQATKDAFSQTAQNLSSYQWLHFSCHGYFNFDSPLKSALALANSVVSGDSANANSRRYLPLINDRELDLEKCLTLADILQLPLDQCRLVTLSACETGLTDPTSSSDEYIGLPSGFLQAGSSSVVSSLWSVDDLSTTLLMIKFYANLQTFPPAKALNQAQCWLRNIKTGELLTWLAKQKIDSKYKYILEYELETWYTNDEQPFIKPVYWAAFYGIGQ